MEFGSRNLEQPPGGKKDTGKQIDRQRRRTPQLLIHEKSDVVVVGGVPMEKAQVADSPLVPERGENEDFMWDSLTADMAQFIVTSWKLKQRPLIETGTGIGKSTLVRKLGELLKAEVHLYNCKGTTEAADFMGGPQINKDHKSDQDPRYVDVPGPVRDALTVEEGKIKILFLDELNFSQARELAALHEVLDALSRNGKVIYNGEVIQTDNTKTFVVAGVNPPGGKFIGRDALDPALLRRWNYYKGPDELPDDISQEVLAYTWENSTLTQQEGFREVLESYWRFHRRIQHAVAENEHGLAEDQPQPFTFNDREEFQRVYEFVHNFYNGNLDDTFRNALRFYYLTSFQSPKDKRMVSAMIEKVGSVEGLVVDPKSSSSSNDVINGFGSANGIFSKPEVTSFDPGESLPSPSGKRRVDDVRLPTHLHEKDTPTLSPQQVIESRERERLGREFGPDVEVKPLPECITPEVLKNLEAAGLRLKYLPEIDLDPNGLAEKNVTEYLVELAERYPQFAQVEELSDAQKGNPDIPRMMERWLWQNIKFGNIEFPRLPGQWVAIETVDKPERGEFYETTPLEKSLKLKRGRFYETPSLLRGQIRKKGNDILRTIGVAGRAELRLLEPAEYTFLGNGEQWGETETYELTNTVLVEEGVKRALVAGNAQSGGVGHFQPAREHEGSQFVGYRLGVFFDP